MSKGLTSASGARKIRIRTRTRTPLGRERFQIDLTGLEFCAPCGADDHRDCQQHGRERFGNFSQESQSGRQISIRGIQLQIHFREVSHDQNPDEPLPKDKSQQAHKDYLSDQNGIETCRRETVAGDIDGPTGGAELSRPQEIRNLEIDERDDKDFGQLRIAQAACLLQMI
jgi:hypothetical protein